MENLIEELTKVDPANLSEEGLKLFNKINEIIDRNRELEKEVVLVPEGTTFLAIPKDMIQKSELSEVLDDIEKGAKSAVLDDDVYYVLDILKRRFLQEGDK